MAVHQGSVSIMWFKSGSNKESTGIIANRGCNKDRMMVGFLAEIKWISNWSLIRILGLILSTTERECVTQKWKLSKPGNHYHQPHIQNRILEILSLNQAEPRPKPNNHHLIIPKNQCLDISHLNVYSKLLLMWWFLRVWLTHLSYYTTWTSYT